VRLAAKTALVTGAQQGIGRAIAIALARDGADVAINYLDDVTAAERVAGEVRGLGRRALLVQGDVSRIDHAEALVTTTVRDLGVPDVLVNNAGVFPRVSFLEEVGHGAVPGDRDDVRGTGVHRGPAS
jgi:NAD(P)-dependent dehydrogenase (short-subunit alcohol dehydrogenase family)